MEEMVGLSRGHKSDAGFREHTLLKLFIFFTLCILSHICGFGYVHFNVLCIHFWLPNHGAFGNIGTIETKS